MVTTLKAFHAVFYTMTLSVILISSAHCYYNSGYTILDLSLSGLGFQLELSNWATSPLMNAGVKSSNCSQVGLLGGYNILNTTQPISIYLSRLYTNLVPHKSVYFTFIVYELGDITTANYINVTFDQQKFVGWNHSYTEWKDQPHSCSPSYPDLTNVSVFGIAPHSSLSLTFGIHISTNTSSLESSYGFRSFTFLFTNNTPSTPSVPFFCAKAVSVSLRSPLECSCPKSSYFDGTNCLPCNKLCNSCFGPTLQQCYECAAGANWNGDSCIICDSSCQTCSGTNANQCVNCYPGNALFNGQFCVAQSLCISPLILSQDTYNNTYCNSPCSSSQFINVDGTCSTTCTFPFVTTQIALNLQVCDYPCGSNQYLYPDGVCRNQCLTPFNSQTIKGQLICLAACQEGWYLHPDLICRSTCLPSFINELIPNYYTCKWTQTKAEEKIALLRAVLTTTIDLFVQVALLIEHANPVPLCLTLLIDTLNYYKYIHIVYASDVQAVHDLTQQVSDRLTPPTPEFLTKQYIHLDLPKTFGKYYSITNFVANSWIECILVLAFLCIHATVYILERITRKDSGWLHLAIKNAHRALHWNYTIAFILYLTGRIILYSSLDFETNKLFLFVPIINFIAASILNLLPMLVIYKIAYVALFKGRTADASEATALSDPPHQQQQDQQQRRQDLQSQPDEGLWKDYTIITDRSRDQQLISHRIYLLLYALRVYFFYLTIAYVSDSPLAQTICITLPNAFMLGYLALVRPLKSKLELAENLYVEITLLAINTITIVLTITSKNTGIMSAVYHDYISYVMLALDITLQATATTYLVLKSTIKAIFYFMKRKHKDIKSQMSSAVRGKKGTFRAVVRGRSMALQKAHERTFNQDLKEQPVSIPISIIDQNSADYGDASIDNSPIQGSSNANEAFGAQRLINESSAYLVNNSVMQFDIPQNKDSESPIRPIKKLESMMYNFNGESIHNSLSVTPQRVYNENEAQMFNNNLDEIEDQKSKPLNSILKKFSKKKTRAFNYNEEPMRSPTPGVSYKNDIGNDYNNDGIYAKQTSVFDSPNKLLSKQSSVQKNDEDWRRLRSMKTSPEKHVKPKKLQDQTILEYRRKIKQRAEDIKRKSDFEAQNSGFDGSREPEAPWDNYAI